MAPIDSDTTIATRDEAEGICDATTPTEDPKEAAISIKNNPMIILGDETVNCERNSEISMRRPFLGFSSLTLAKNIGPDPTRCPLLKPIRWIALVVGGSATSANLHARLY